MPDKFRTTFPFVSTIKKRLGSSKYNLQVKFDSLSKRSLNETMRRGTKLLHISSDMITEASQSKLFLEHKFGEAKAIKMNQLADMLVNAQAQTIELVGVAIPNSQHIGEVLLQKGIKHVLCFSSKAAQNAQEHQLEKEYDLIQPRLNYI